MTRTGQQMGEFALLMGIVAVTVVMMQHWVRRAVSFGVQSGSDQILGALPDRDTARQGILDAVGASSVEELRRLVADDPNLIEQLRVEAEARGYPVLQDLIPLGEIDIQTSQQVEESGQSVSVVKTHTIERLQGTTEVIDVQTRPLPSVETAGSGG